MAQRVPFPADVCPEPGVKFYRTVAEAFLCGPREAVAVQRFEPPRLWRWVLLAVLVLGIGAALAGCDVQAADAPAPTAAEIKRAAAGAWLCPGMHAEWLDAATVQCLKEKT